LRFLIEGGYRWVNNTAYLCYRQHVLDVASVERRFADPETIGALLHEIAYAPALTFMGHPKTGEPMRCALAPWLGRSASG
jgi:hypothetical protein